MSAIERIEPESPLIGGDPMDAARVEAYYDFQSAFPDTEPEEEQEEQLVATEVSVDDLELPDRIIVEDWQRSANCKGKGDLFFPRVTYNDKLDIVETETDKERDARLAKAVQICVGCMVRSQCDVRVI